jgi:hypothetical protein
LYLFGKLNNNNSKVIQCASEYSQKKGGDFSLAKFMLNACCRKLRYPDKISTQAFPLETTFRKCMLVNIEVLSFLEARAHVVFVKILHTSLLVLDCTVGT